MNGDVLTVLGIALLFAVGLAVWRNAREAQARRTTQARYDASIDDGKAAYAESHANQARMLALLEQANATLLRIEAGLARRDPP